MSRFQLWTARQQLAVGAILSFLLLLWCTRLLINRSFIDTPQPPDPLLESRLADRIDPNTVGAAELSVLPMIGPKRAADIIAYRDQFTSIHPGRPAFESPADLKRIKGIGDAMVEQMSPYLIFPATRPSTRAAD